jgi:small subunit ribosomal protein S6
MRTYEQLFIVNTAAVDTDVDALLEQLTGIITSTGGTLDKTDKWGVRKLAYRVDRQTEGSYILLCFSCGSQTVRELERRLRVSDLVLKFITVRMDERMKRVAKRQKRREKRLARKPQLAAPAAPPAAPAVPGEVPAAPAMPAAPAPEMPAAPDAAPAAAEPAAEN